MLFQFAQDTSPVIVPLHLVNVTQVFQFSAVTMILIVKEIEKNWNSTKS